MWLSWSRAGMEQFRKKRHALEEGDDLSFCRLVPSFSDRKAFFECITEFGQAEV